jgi:quercetin dioxygenase-like cupin family protein
VLVNKAADREWKATDHDGIERSLFRTNETGGRSSVVRLTQGSRFPRHAHGGTEEVVVLAGIVRIGGVEVSTGDYPFTSPGEEHDVVAISDATIFVSSQNTPIVEAVDSRARIAMQIDGSSGIQEIKVLGDWAFMWTRLTVVMTPPNGAQSVKRAGHTLSILKSRTADG